MKDFFRKNILIILIAILSAVLRFYKLNWDFEGVDCFLFHPDERNIINIASSIHFFDRLNPHFFAYGTFLSYLTHIIALFLQKIFVYKINFFTWPSLIIIARGLSAFAGVITVVCVYILGKRLYNNEIGILSALFLSLNVFHIQNCHFCTVEALLTLFITLIYLTSLNIWENGRLKDYIITGVIMGIALATKATAISFIIVPIVAHLLSNYKSLNMFSLAIIFRGWQKWVLFFLIVVAVFFICDPYAILSYKELLKSMKYESSMVFGKVSPPYTLQFNDTVPVMFQFKQIIIYGIGAWLGVFAVLGFVYSLGLLFVKRRPREIFLFSWILPYFIITDFLMYTKFMRYNLLLYPFLILFGIVFIKELCAVIFKEPKTIKKVNTTVFLILIMASFIYCYAFMNLYNKPQTKIEASVWIYQNIPCTSKITWEIWDDKLPLPVKQSIGKINHQSIIIDMYKKFKDGPEEEQKLFYISEVLSQSDYIVYSSSRVRNSILKNPKDYRYSCIYYNIFRLKALNEVNELGFVKVASFKSYPSILSFEFVDDKAEENFQIFDHPVVDIYKNYGNFDLFTIKDIIIKKSKSI